MDEFLVSVVIVLTVVIIFLLTPNPEAPRIVIPVAEIHTGTYSHTSEYVGEFNGCELYYVTVSKTDATNIASVLTTTLINKCPQEALK